MKIDSSFLIKETRIGYALHKIILDKEQNPIDYTFVEVNDAYLAITGLNISIIGRTILDVYSDSANNMIDWIQLFKDDSTSDHLSSVERYSQSVKIWYTVNCHRPYEGYLLVLLTPLPKRYTSIYSDTHLELKNYRNESLVKILAHQATDTHDLLDYALDEAIALTKSDIGYIYFYNNHKHIFNLNSWSTKVMNLCEITEKQTIYQLEKTGFWGEVIRQKKAIINNNFQAPHPLKKGFPKGHATLYRYMSLPIYDQGEIVAVIGLGNKKDHYNENDIMQIQLFMAEVWTIFKRKLAETQLQREKDLLATTIETIGDGIITLDENFSVLNINVIAQKLLEINQENIIERLLFEQLELNHSKLIHLLKNDLKHKKNESSQITDLAFEKNVIYKYKDKLLEVKLSAISTTGTFQSGYVLVLKDVTDDHIYKQKIEFLSYHDPLTGLYNRRFFEEELLRLNTKRQLPITVIMGDVNGLKLTNDAFGHLAGDELLKEVSNILTKSCRKEDVIARWGGDEFVILLPKTTEERAQEIIRTITGYCKDSNNQLIDVSISLGSSTKKDGDSIENLITDAENQLYSRKLSESKSQRSAIIETIKSTLYERNHETEEHGYRLIDYSMAIAKQLNLTEVQIQDLRLLALLHDIGKIGVADHILLKDGPLTEEEWCEMKKHPVIGYRIAQSSADLHPIATLILHHHEHWDGNGYPDQIKGESIPLLSRIVAVADAYDAMTSDRPYRKALSKKKATEELSKNRGTQFDPLVADVFINYLSSLD